MNRLLTTGKRNLIYILALTIMFSAFSHTSAKAEATELGCGGLEYAWEDLKVYNAKSGGSVIGKIFENESFTILIQDAPEGYLWVDYSTSNGGKRGYVHIPNDEWGGRPDAPARVKNTTNVYYGRPGNGSKYQKAGAVYSGEYVTIIAASSKNPNWVYIEYNGSNKRKRGFVPLYNLEVSPITPEAYRSVYNDDSSDQESHKQYFSGSATVYAGPTKLYAAIGSVKDEYVYRYGREIHIGPYSAYYIEYYVTNTSEMKCGFIVYE